jgi:hypothetical protein
VGESAFSHRRRAGKLTASLINWSSKSGFSAIRTSPFSVSVHAAPTGGQRNGSVHNPQSKWPFSRGRGEASANSVFPHARVPGRGQATARSRSGAGTGDRGDRRLQGQATPYRGADCSRKTAGGGQAIAGAGGLFSAVQRGRRNTFPSRSDHGTSRSARLQSARGWKQV